MPRRSAARLLALVALVVLVPLDVVLFPPVLSSVKSLPLRHPATTPTTPGRPAATGTPAPHGPVAISAAYNNTGIGLDGVNDADFDTFGDSYSEQALTAAGLAPGAAVTSDGVQYVMPHVPAGQRDNVRASGQTILAPKLPGATLLAFLGAASGGGATGTVKITYSDGTTQYGTLSFSDWTLVDGAFSTPEPDNRVVAALAYQDVGPQQDETTTYVFASAPVQLQAGKAIKWVRLPATGGASTIHLFSIGTDKGAFS